MNTAISKVKSGESVKSIAGKDYQVAFYAPTAKEWEAHFTRGLERLAEDYNQHKVANNLASKLKAAAALANGTSEVKNPKPETVEAAKALMARLEAGDVFDLREFVAKDAREGADKREVLVGYEKLLTMVGEKWETTPTEKRVAFLAKYKLELEPESTAGAVASAIQAKYKAPVIATEDSELG